jgi:HK97 family phage portal protein
VSLLFRERRVQDAASLIPARPSYVPGLPAVSGESAMRQSAVWACLRLRADQVSTCPVDVFRRINGAQIEVEKPQVLVTTGGKRVRFREWMYSTQVDLDRYGNDFGYITARDAMGLPAQIDLIPASDVRVKLHKSGDVTYYVGRTEYDALDIWHEKQYTVAGLPIGLSPISHAALSIAQGLTAQQFAVQWYAGNAIPDGQLKNTKKEITAKAAAEAKERFTTAMSSGGIFVTGNDWEFSPVEAQSNDQKYLDTMGASAVDVCRFLGVPSDMIDAPSQGSSITYGNITQRNLQLLVINLGPAFGRREDALSQLVRDGSYVKLNTDALIRMDPVSRSTMLGQQIRDRIRTPQEVRDLENLPPLTPEDLAEFAAAFGTGGGSKERKLAAAEILQKVYLAVGKVISSDEARQIANAAGAELSIPGPDFTPEGLL